MVLTGRWRVENLSAVSLSEDGVDYGDPPVRFGDVVVPARVAVTIEGEKGGPSARLEFAIRGDGGEPACTAVHIVAGPKGRGIRTGDLASLPGLRELAADAFLELAMVVSEAPFDWHVHPRDRERRAAARRSIKTRGDAELQEVARVYRENVNDRPTQAVEEWGSYSRRTAARKVALAREAGYLPPTTRGKARA